MYDIIIIGAGPSGSTLSRMLDKNHNILLVDKRNMSENEPYKSEKCCGGLLAPDAQKALAQLGLGVPKEVLTGPQMFSVKAIDFDNKIERFYSRDYINIDREKFDRWLVSLVPDSVEVKFNCLFNSYNIFNDYIEVKLRTNGKEHIVRTKILVGADGAISRIRSQMFKDNVVPQKYIAIQESYKTNYEMPYYTSIFDKNTTDFYSWIIQKENSLLVGSAIPIKRNANKRYRQLINKLKKQGTIKGKAIKRTGTLIMRTRNDKQIHALKGNIAFVGEAAGFISPSSAEGISYALRSGAMLANSINEDRNNFGQIYLKKIKLIRINLFLKNIKVHIIYNSFLRHIIMKSKILSMSIKDIY
ncbi:MAG: oxidoreductase [Firmicutes bacterium HGW-Firmicutes-7]|nr:MAG: oxidoreductase [Firmicutes bacterium HGW-Firmicutes-7]